MTESLLFLASLVGLPCWLVGTVAMLGKFLLSVVIDYFVDLAVQAFFSRLWRVVRPLLSRWRVSFEAWRKSPRASASPSTTSTTSAASSSATCAALAAGTSTPPGSCSSTICTSTSCAASTRSPSTSCARLQTTPPRPARLSRRSRYVYGCMRCDAESIE